MAEDIFEGQVTTAASSSVHTSTVKWGHSREVLRSWRRRRWGREGYLCHFDNIVMEHSSGVLFFRISALCDVILKSSAFVMLIL